MLIMLKALIFDFDGLILDTETPELYAWQEVYRDHGQEFTVHTFGQIVGGTAGTDFEPVAHLEQLTGKKLDSPQLYERVKEQRLALIYQQAPLPGVNELINDARRLGLKLAVASSSTHEWVDGHLTRLGLFPFFDVIKASEDVQRTKPEPDLFLAALSALGVQPEEAVVLEDSPNGVLAAKRAGLFVVAVPNTVTQELLFEGEDLCVSSLAEVSLPELQHHMDSALN